jgi:nucleoside-diphosphate-sugar epimerase
MPVDRFLVTGALGCIGAWTVRNLVRAGVPTVAFDRSDDRHRIELIMTADEIAQVSFVRGDVTDLAGLERTLDDHAITHVIHLAAMLMPACRADPPHGARVNVVGTVNLFEAVARRREHVDRVIYASSIAVYDAAGEEEPGAAISHDTVGHPTSLYGVYKQAIEGVARVYWQDNHVASIGLRPATVYGPGRDNGITAAPTRAMFAAAAGQPYHIPYGGRGELQYADDVARVFIACAKAPFEGAEIFNLHGSVADMAEVVAAVETAAPEMRGRITFSPAPFPSPEEFDPAPLTELIGPLPCTPLHGGVAATIGLFRDRIARGMMPRDALLR